MGQLLLQLPQCPVVQFEVPDPKDDPELWDLVTHLQTHRHRATCQTLASPRFEITKEEQEELSPEELKQKEEDSLCRFKFPREPFHQTWIETSLPKIERVWGQSFHRLIHWLIIDSQEEEERGHPQSQPATALRPAPTAAAECARPHASQPLPDKTLTPVIIWAWY